MRQIRQGKAIEIPGLSIIPVECVVIDGLCHPHGIAISVEYTPIGIILDDGGKRWAIGIDGTPLDPDTLIKSG